MAQESIDTSGQDWSDIVKSYNKNTIERPITPQEVEQAVQAIKSLQKPPKQPKKHWWSFGKKPKAENVQPVREKEPQRTETLPSGDPLLRLYSDININGKIIKKGFYLVDYVKRDEIYYLRLKQESDKYQEIEAKQVSGSIFDGRDITAEYTPEKNVKITYRAGTIYLVAEVPVAGSR